MNVKKIELALLGVLIFWTETVESKISDPCAQLHFSAEGAGVEKSVPIPDDVLAILREDEMVRIALANENISAGNVPLS